MIINLLKKSFWMLTCAMLLGAVSVAQTPPPNQRSQPQLPKPKQLLLEVELKLNAGAASTKERSVTLNFTATEKSEPGHLTVRDVTAEVTHYRVREAPDSR